MQKFPWRTEGFIIPSKALDCLGEAKPYARRLLALAKRQVRLPRSGDTVA
jgi:hypothetical protein